MEISKKKKADFFLSDLEIVSKSKKKKIRVPLDDKVK